MCLEASGGSRLGIPTCPAVVPFVGYYRRRAARIARTLGAHSEQALLRSRRATRLDSFYHDTLQIGSAPACAYLLACLRGPSAPRPKRPEGPCEAGSKSKRGQRNTPPLRCTKETRPRRRGLMAAAREVASRTMLHAPPTHALPSAVPPLILHAQLAGLDLILGLNLRDRSRRARFCQ